MSATLTAAELARATMPPEMEPITPGDNTIPRMGNPQPVLRAIRMVDLLNMALPQPEFVVPELLPVGLTMLAGRPKTGKSWLGLQGCQAVGSGGMFLGYRASKGKPLYLALEDPLRRIQERARLQGWTTADTDVLTMAEARTFLPLNKRGRALRDAIAAGGYTLVVIDTLSKALAGDQDDVSAMTAALAPLQEAAHANGCAIVIIDHHNKGGAPQPGISDPDSYDPVTNILGSTAKAAIADCVWGLYKSPGKAGATLAITGRDVADARLSIKFDPLTYCWQLGDGLTDARRAVLQAVGEFNGVTCQELAIALGRNRGPVYKDLQELIKAGLVVRDDDVYIPLNKGS